METPIALIAACVAVGVFVVVGVLALVTRRRRIARARPPVHQDAALSRFFNLGNAATYLDASLTQVHLWIAAGRLWATRDDSGSVVVAVSSIRQLWEEIASLSTIDRIRRSCEDIVIAFFCVLTLRRRFQQEQTAKDA